MDGELLRQLYHELFHHNKLKTDRRCTYSDTIILFVHFLAVIHDRSHRWAYDRRNWPLWARRLPTPSYSQLMRRLGTTAIRIHIETFNQTFRARLPRSTDKAVTARPTPSVYYTGNPVSIGFQLQKPPWAVDLWAVEHGESPPDRQAGKITAATNHGRRDGRCVRFRFNPAPTATASTSNPTAWDCCSMRASAGFRPSDGWLPATATSAVSSA